MRPRWGWTMNADTQPPKRQGDIISSLNVAIEVLNIAKEVSSITPAKAVFGTVSALLAMIKVHCLLSFVAEFLPAHACLGFDD